MTSYLLTGGRVVDPVSGTDAVRDVVIADEGGAKFEVHWVHPDLFMRGEAPLYPDGLLELLSSNKT